MRNPSLLVLALLLAPSATAVPGLDWVAATQVEMEGSHGMEADAWWLRLSGGDAAPDPGLRVDSPWLELIVGRSEQDVTTGTDIGERTNDTRVYEGPAQIYVTAYRPKYTVLVNATDAPGMFNASAMTILPPRQEQATSGDSPASDRPPMRRELAESFEVDQPRGAWHATGEMAMRVYELDLTVITPDETFEVWTGERYEPPGGVDGVPLGGSVVYQDAIIASSNASVVLDFGESVSKFFAWDSTTRVNGTVSIDTVGEREASEFSGHYIVRTAGTASYGLETEVVAYTPPGQTNGTVEQPDIAGEPPASPEMTPDTSTVATQPANHAWMWITGGIVVALVAAIVLDRVLWRIGGRAFSNRSFAWARRLCGLSLWRASRRPGSVLMYAVATVHERGPAAAERFLTGLSDARLPDPATLEYLLAVIRLEQGRIEDARGHVQACVALNEGFLPIIQGTHTLAPMMQDRDIDNTAYT